MQQFNSTKCKVCGGVLSKRTSLGYVCDFCGCAESDYPAHASDNTVQKEMKLGAGIAAKDLVELLQKDHKHLQDAYNKKVEECNLAYDTISDYADRNRGLKTMLSVYIGLTFLFIGLSAMLLYMYI